MKKVFSYIGINFMVLSALLVAIEIVIQFVYFSKNGYFIAFKPISQHSELFETHPFLVVRPKASVKAEMHESVVTAITTTKEHTRWTGAPEEDDELIRVAILGGSTTFGTGVTDEDSWPAQLQARLGDRYAVINYGLPGFSTAENIIQMALVVPEKQPHIVIFYEGWNDIHNYHVNDLGADYYSHGMQQAGHLGLDVHEKRYQLATTWMADKLKTKLTGAGQPTLQVKDVPDPFVDKVYARNLSSLKALAENSGAFAVFIPQVLNYPEFYGKEGSRHWSKHIKDNAMPALMDRFNTFVKGVCSPNEKGCTVLSEVLDEPWVEQDFVDEGHFSKAGGVKMSAIVAEQIRARTALLE